MFFTQLMSSLTLWNFITVNVNGTLFDVTTFRSVMHFMYVERMHIIMTKFG